MAALSANKHDSVPWRVHAQNKLYSVPKMHHNTLLVIISTSISANADGPRDAASRKIANTTLHTRQQRCERYLKHIATRKTVTSPVG